MNKKKKSINLEQNFIKYKTNSREIDLKMRRGREIYKDMKSGDNEAGKEGFEAAMEEFRTPSEENDGVIRDGDNCSDE